MLNRALPPLTLLAAAALGAGGLAAQEINLGGFSDLSELKLSDLLNVTVSIAAAGRIQSLEEAPSIVSVITAEDIRRMGAHNLEDVLETLPGFEVLVDEVGRLRISVRGLATQGTTENVLILLNGLRLNNQLWGGATATHFNFPVQNLRQIEVIRGPGSALYGSNAFVGVVNMVTWDAQTFDGTEALVTLGQFGTRQVVGTTAHVLGGVSLSGSFQYRKVDGTGLRLERDAATLLDQLNALLGIPPISLAPGRITDGREEFNAQARAQIGDFTLDATVADQRSEGNVSRFNTLSTRSFLDSRQAIVSGSWNRRLGERTSIDVTAGVMAERYEELVAPLGPGFVRVIDQNTRYVFPEGLLFQFDLRERRVNGGLVLRREMSGSNDLTLGLGFEWEETTDPNTFGNFSEETGASKPQLERLRQNAIDPRSRSVFSAFLQDTWNPVPALGVTGGVRFDHYDDFGATLNPRLGLVWRVQDDLYVKGLYGRAFRAPTFAELGFGVDGSLKGNPDLEPAVINTVEAAVGYRRANLRVGVNYFATFIRDFITAATPLSIANVAEELRYFNSAGLDIQGVEFEARRSFGFDHDLFANYTFQKVTDPQLGGTPGGVPEHLGNVGATFALGDYLSVTPVLHVRGERRRLRLDPRDPVPGYAVLNVNTRLINVFETLEISVALRNALDQTYVDPAPLVTMPDDYPRPGRHVFVKASYKF